MSTSTAPIPTQVPTLAPLTFSTDYVATARAMAAAGYGQMTSARRFLAFDRAGDGRAVEVVGDLATARRIVILVPGNDTTLRDFDRGLGGVARRAPAVQARAVYDAVQARAVYDAVQARTVTDAVEAPAATGAVEAVQARTAYEAAGRRSGVAIVAWLGYDPPEGIGIAVVREERARAGAVELQRFVASLPAGATITVVGHSYGSTVVGLAASGFGPAVTDLVAIASPGLGVSSVAELRTGARVWAATSDRDWIRRVPHVKLAGFGHGADPTEPGFGARLLPSGNVSNHDSYLVPGSETLAALVPVILAG